MRFEWDEHKAAANLRKHGVSFEEAATIFRDSLVQVDADWEHGEARLVAIGMSDRDRLLFTVVLELRGDVLRIISARKAERHERKRYEEG